MSLGETEQRGTNGNEMVSMVMAGRGNVTPLVMVVASGEGRAVGCAAGEGGGDGGGDGGGGGGCGGKGVNLVW